MHLNVTETKYPSGGRHRSRLAYLYWITYLVLIWDALTDTITQLNGSYSTLSTRAGIADALAVCDDVVFATGPAPIGRVWTGFLPAPNRSNCPAIHGSSGPIDAPIGVQFRQNNLMKSLPYSSLFPVPQPPPASHTAATTHLAWQILPWDSRLENKHNARQCGPVTHRRTTAFFTGGLPFWNQWLNSSPQFIAHQSFRHDVTLLRQQ